MSSNSNQGQGEEQDACTTSTAVNADISRTLPSTMKPEKPEVSQVPITLPPFYFNGPSTWFKTLESQFHLAGISNNSTKSHHVIANLPESVALNIPDSLDYNILKDAILKYTTKSRLEKMEDALGPVSLDGQRPSTCLARIERKFRECDLNPDPAILKHKLMMALPVNVRQIKATQDDKDTKTFAEIADAVLAASNLSDTTVCTIYNTTNRAASFSRITNREPLRTLQTSPFFRGQKPKICRAHIYYADLARSCRPWCRYPSKKRLPTTPKRSSAVSDRSPFAAETVAVVEN